MKQAHVAQCLGWVPNIVQIKQQWGNTNSLVNDSLVVRAFNPLCLQSTSVSMEQDARRRTHAEPLSITVFGLLGCCPSERC